MNKQLCSMYAVFVSAKLWICVCVWVYKCCWLVNWVSKRSRARLTCKKKNTAIWHQQKKTTTIMKRMKTGEQQKKNHSQNVHIQMGSNFHMKQHKITKQTFKDRILKEKGDTNKKKQINKQRCEDKSKTSDPRAHNSTGKRWIICVAIEYGIVWISVSINNARYNCDGYTFSHRPKMCGFGLGWFLIYTLGRIVKTWKIDIFFLHVVGCAFKNSYFNYMKIGKGHQKTRFLKNHFHCTQAIIIHSDQHYLNTKKLIGKLNDRWQIKIQISKMPLITVVICFFFCSHLLFLHFLVFLVVRFVALCVVFTWQMFCWYMPSPIDVYS